MISLIVIGVATIVAGYSFLIRSLIKTNAFGTPTHNSYFPLVGVGI